MAISLDCNKLGYLPKCRLKEEIPFRSAPITEIGEGRIRQVSLLISVSGMLWWSVATVPQLPARNMGQRSIAIGASSTRLAIIWKLNDQPSHCPLNIHLPTSFIALTLNRKEINSKKSKSFLIQTT